MIKMKQALLGAVVFSLCAVASAADLVTNGGFETGNFSGWTNGGNTGFTGVESQGFSAGAASGTYFAFFGPVGSQGTLSQSLATVAGQTYTLSFDLADSRVAANETFAVSYNGVTLDSFAGGNPSAPGYDHYQFTFTGVDAGTLQFDFRNDPDYYLLDNVSVTTSAVPEPASNLLMLAGLGALGLAAARRRSAR